MISTCVGEPLTRYLVQSETRVVMLNYGQNDLREYPDGCKAAHDLGYSPGKEQEYFDSREGFQSGSPTAGSGPNNAWFTIYGNRPQIMASMQSGSIDTLRVCSDHQK